MKENRNISKSGLLVTIMLVCMLGHAQDKIYTTNGKTINAKVSDVFVYQVRFTYSDDSAGPVYTMDKREIDSIVYHNGRVDLMTGYVRKKGKLENIPQLNTWTFDLLGFTFLSVSQSYERRFKDGLIGLRIPFYIGFFGGGFAGVGTFSQSTGVYYPQFNGNGYGGASFATGINPKFYLIKRRVVRPFIGPEATIGYSVTNSNYNYNGNPNNYYYGNGEPARYRYGIFTLMGKAGLSFNPRDKFNITIDGGAGVGDQFGKFNPIGWTGLWHIGFSMGTNF